MPRPISAAEIQAGLERLGLRSRRVVAHSSLTSFGHVEGGAAAVASAFAATFRTLLVPAFNWGEGSAMVAPPPEESIERNGIDPGFFESLPERAVAFDPARSGMVAAMGAVPRAVFELAGAVRSAHPLASWVAVGENARELTEQHDFAAPLAPLERLTDLDGHVLLAGVDLHSCTALHLAEQRVGRKPFVRWVQDALGHTARVRVSGCSDGFDKLWPELASLFVSERVGGARLAAAALGDLVARAAALLQREPELTTCKPECARCRDAVLGGPTS